MVVATPWPCTSEFSGTMFRMRVLLRDTLCCLTFFKWSLEEELLNNQHLHTPCSPEHCGHFSGTLSTHFLLRPLSGSFLINVIVTSWLSKWLEYLLIISSYGLRLPYEADHVIVLSPPNIDLSLMKVLMYFDMCPSIETFNQQSESYDSNLAKNIPRGSPETPRDIITLWSSLMQIKFDD